MNDLLPWWLAQELQMSRNLRLSYMNFQEYNLSKVQDTEYPNLPNLDESLNKTWASPNAGWRLSNSLLILTTVVSPLCFPSNMHSGWLHNAATVSPLFLPPRQIAWAAPRPLHLWPSVLLKIFRHTQIAVLTKAGKLPYKEIKPRGWRLNNNDLLWGAPRTALWEGIEAKEPGLLSPRGHSEAIVLLSVWWTFWLLKESYTL